MTNKNNNNKAFSLIELSIVLIIMGLLVAGVTGGASLIKSAQLRAVVNEFTNYRTAYNTYYAQFNKVPGSDADPNTIADGTGALTDLATESIIDREPTPDDTNNYVASRFGKGARWYLNNAASDFKISDFVGLNVLSLSGSADYTTGALTGSEASSIDDKVDDGQGNTGLVRGITTTASSASEGEAYGTDDDTNRNTSLVSRMDF